jgi:hypothetical protein
MRSRGSLPLITYAYAIRLIYPVQLRRRYIGQMLQTARDAHSERRSGAGFFWAYLYLDLVRSSLQEHTRMFRYQLFARPIFFHTLTLGFILTAWGLFAAMSIQGALRRSADQPQLRMAQDYAAMLTDGSTADKILPSTQVDIANSAEPFAIFYNSAGQPVAASGYILNSIPVPPSGVFQYMRAHSSDKFTWQPLRGVRIAAVVRRVDGNQPGFILVGRSLQATELEELTLRRATFLSWTLLMCLLGAGATYLDRAQRLRTKPLAA